MRFSVLPLVGWIGFIAIAASQEIPKTWDDAEMEQVALPLADASAMPAMINWSGS